MLHTIPKTPRPLDGERQQKLHGHGHEADRFTEALPSCRGLPTRARGTGMCPMPTHHARFGYPHVRGGLAERIRVIWTGC